MSNSDKFQQDDAIVEDSAIEQQSAGVLDGEDVGEPADVVDDADERANDEYDGIKEENIIDGSGLLSEVGQRGVKEPSNYAEADSKADALVEQVTEEQNDGTSRIA
ncbi:hypothetical protein JCM11641_001073 [Rhodosporidiobolus odoratus]